MTWNISICIYSSYVIYFISTNHHYGDAIMGVIASQITSLVIVCSTVHSDADQRKHQSSASLAFVQGIHWGPVNSLHKWAVMRKMFPFDNVIMMQWIIMRMKMFIWCLWYVMQQIYTKYVDHLILWNRFIIYFILVYPQTVLGILYKIT